MSANTVADVVNRSIQRLTASDTATLDVQVMLASVLNVQRSFFYTWPDKVLDNQVIEQFEQLLARRVKGEPIAYIVGEQEFWSLPLKVSPSTLIPRPETELLVETVLDSLALTHAKGIDLGTGTGAIALAIASERSSWQLLGVDYSDDAVALAQQNQQRLAINNVEFIQSDWLSNVDGNWQHHCDFIVSNPPYIDEHDPHLSQGDVRFEPHSALVAKEQGLQDIKVIAQQSQAFLISGGLLLIEHGFEQGAQVRDILNKQGYLNTRTIKDLAQLDRITIANAK